MTTQGHSCSQLHRDGERLVISCLQVVLAMRVEISLGTTVQWRPFGLVLEQPHGLDILVSASGYPCPKWPVYDSTHIVLVRREPMIDTRRQDNQVVFLKPDSHPVIILTSDIEVASSVANVSDLFVFVEVLIEEHFYFVFVDCAHGVGRDSDFIAILVLALSSDGIHGGDFGAVVVEHAQAGEV